MDVSAIILAAGASKRFGLESKQFLNLNGKSVLKRSVEKFIEAGVDEIIIATLYEKIEYVENSVKNLNYKIKVTNGGSTRQESAKKAFKLCSKNGIVLIHDAARPFVSPEKIKELVKVTKKTGAATLAISSTDSVKLAENKIIEKSLNRNKVFLTQTPQAFLKEIYSKALKLKIATTDDCQLVEQLGVKISIVSGEKTNFKITTKEDLIFASALTNLKNPSEK